MSIGCRDLVVSTGDRVLLEVASLDIAGGDTLAVLGPNGAGKSTLLRALAHLCGLIRTGDVLPDGHPATSAEMRAAVAAVLQRPVLQRTSTLDNAAAGLRLRGTTRFASQLTGGSGLLVARPERCQLLEPGASAPPNAIVVSGTVRRIVPLGGTTRVDVDTAAEPVAALTTAEVTAVPGQAVRVAVHLEHVRRVPETARPSSGARPSQNTATSPD